MTAAQPQSLAERSLGWRVVEITSIVLAVLILASLLYLAVDVLLLVFAGILLATVLRAPTEALARLGVPERLALALVVLGMLGLLATLVALLAPEVGAQVPDLLGRLGEVARQLQRETGLEALAEMIAEEIDLGGLLPSTAGLIGGATGLISSTFGTIANFVIIAVLGIYLAATPAVYVDGFTRLVPQPKRPQARETLHAIGLTLRWWMIGQLISMTAVGVLSYLGLKLLGVPLALVLSVIAFFLTFIPFLGPILSAIPVVLVAFAQGADVALYALGLYALIQSFEGYVLTPLVQRRVVSLPPALTITAQVLLGVLVGAFGIALATPLAAATMVAVAKLYVGEVLGEEVEVGGLQREASGRTGTHA